MECERTDYDKMMKEMFNPMKENYHAPPFPGYRTNFDKELQAKWCPKCGNPTPPSPPAPPGPPRPSRRRVVKESYEPMYGFRTKYDDELQKKWCDKC